MPELDVRRGIARTLDARQLLGLRARARQVAREAEQAHQQPPRGHVLRVLGEILLQRGDGLVVVAHAATAIAPAPSHSAPRTPRNH